MDQIRSLQLIALKNRLIDPPDESYRWRQICRWYSKTFATPLDEVEDLPRLDILQHYIEEQYDQADDQELHQELDRLLQTEEELKAALDKAKEDANMDKLMAETKAQNAKNGAVPHEVKEQEEDPKIERTKIPKEVFDSLDGLGQVLTDIKKTLDEQPSSFDIDFSDVPI